MRPGFDKTFPDECVRGYMRRSGGIECDVPSGAFLMPRISWLFLFSFFTGLTAIASTSTDGAQSGLMLPLRENWFIQSSAEVHADGATISRPGFPTSDWYPATLPSTVLSALVEQKVYPDPYTGMNLRSIPGTTYPIFEDFANIQMPPASPFRKSWWYRTEFKLSADYKGKTIWLGFDGINYRANVWMNGVQIANSEHLAGTWRLFQFDVTATAKPGDTNTLAIEVFPPQPRDLAITLVDWAPMPPDKEMGIWRDAHISATGPIRLSYPAVLTKLNLPSTNEAALVVRAELTNSLDHPVDGVLKGQIEKIAFEQQVHLGARETQVVRFTS